MKVRLPQNTEIGHAANPGSRPGEKMPGRAGGQDLPMATAPVRSQCHNKRRPALQCIIQEILHIANMDSVKYVPGSNSNMHLGVQGWQDPAPAAQGNIQDSPAWSVAGYSLVLYADAAVSGLQWKGSVANRKLGALENDYSAPPSSRERSDARDETSEGSQEPETAQAV